VKLRPINKNVKAVDSRPQRDQQKKRKRKKRRGVGLGSPAADKLGCVTKTDFQFPKKERENHGVRRTYAERRLLERGKGPKKESKKMGLSWEFRFRKDRYQ